MKKKSSKQMLVIGSDHAGVELKKELKKQLEDQIEFIDVGAFSTKSVDYPDVALKAALKMAEIELNKKRSVLAVLICGSGIGVSIAANKCPGIRATPVWDLLSARLAREHNHANVITLGARFIAPAYAAEIIKSWLNAEPNLEDRHQRRVDKIHSMEEGEE